MRYDLLVEIVLPVSGTLRYSIHGTTTADQVWERRLEGISDLVREVEPGGGVGTIPSVRIRLRDADNAIRRKASTEPLQGRSVTILVADLEAGTTAVVFTGRVTQSSSTATLVTLEARDDSWDLLQEPVPSIQVFPDLFPHMPRTTPVALVPLVFGTVSSTAWDSRGHLPAYLVDPAIGQSKFRYVAAQHPLKAVTAVYRDGEAVTSGWSVAYANVVTAWGTKRMTFIDFVADPRESGDRDVRITYDGQGLTDTNLEGGTLLTNPAAVLKAILTTHGPLSSGDFDATFQAAAESAYTTAGLTAAGAVVDASDSWLDVIGRFAESFSLQFFRTRTGRWAIRFDNAAAPGSTAGLAHLTDARDVVRDSYGLTRSEALSRIEFAYAHDLARGAAVARAEQIDSGIYTLLGRHATEPRDYMCLRSVNHGRLVAEIQLHQARQARVQLTTTPLPTLELGDAVLLTHFAGEGADGLGWSGRTFRVGRIIVGLNNRGLRLKLGLIDCPGLTPGSYSDTEPGRTSVEPPPANAEMFTDLVFEPVDRDTVTWTSGTLKVVWGRRSRSYSIAAGSTGNMALGTQYYVYLDPDTSITTLQVNPTMANAVGDNKRLVAVCRAAPDSTQNALVDNRIGFVVVNSATVPRRASGDQIPYDSIYNDHIRAGTIEAGKLSANLVYTGTLVLRNGTDEKAGMTADTGGDGAVRIWAGAAYASRTTAPFRVTQGGVLFARGATFETAETGARITITPSGLTTYDGSGNVLVEMPTAGGNAGLIVLSASDTTPGKIVFGSVGEIYCGTGVSSYPFAILPKAHDTHALQIGSGTFAWAGITYGATQHTFQGTVEINGLYLGESSNRIRASGVLSSILELSGGAGATTGIDLYDKYTGGSVILGVRTGGVTITGTLALGGVTYTWPASAGATTYLMHLGGNLSWRTGSQVRGDIGAAEAGHNHSGESWSELSLTTLRTGYLRDIFGGDGYIDVQDPLRAASGYTPDLGTASQPFGALYAGLAYVTGLRMMSGSSPDIGTSSDKFYRAWFSDKVDAGTLYGGTLQVGSGGIVNYAHPTAVPIGETTKPFGACHMNSVRLGGAITYAGSHNTATARSTGVGTIKFADGTNRDCVGFIQVVISGTNRYIPVFAAN